MLSPEDKIKLIKYIGRHGNQSDENIAVVTGFSRDTVGRTRRQLGFLKKRGPSKQTGKDCTLARLGTKKEIEFALSKGGKTLVDIVRDANLNITRERARQLIKQHYGLRSTKKMRTLAWYARRHNHPELADESEVEKMIREYGFSKTVHALKMSESTFKRMCPQYCHESVTRAKYSRVEIVCESCTTHFFLCPWEVRTRLKLNPDKKWFCGNECKGRWLGQNHGFSESKKSST